MSEARTIKKLEAMVYAQWCWHAHPNNGETEWQESDTKKALDRIIDRDFPSSVSSAEAQSPQKQPSGDLPPPDQGAGRAL